MAMLANLRHLQRLVCDSSGQPQRPVRPAGRRWRSPLAAALLSRRGEAWGAARSLDASSSRAPVRGALTGRGLFGNLARAPRTIGPPDVGFPAGKCSYLLCVNPFLQLKTLPRLGLTYDLAEATCHPLRGWEVLAPGALPPAAVEGGGGEQCSGEGSRPEQEGCWDNFVIIGPKAAEGHQFCPSRS
uniref:Uncharacterized protein n=1 Tax=Myotis myotis TaxID=51298 RepID=A0A7J7RLT5_MYOMY|nr:hypothetical protein mMyoMyo1_010270 [Myotis myotis]